MKKVLVSLVSFSLLFFGFSVAHAGTPTPSVAVIDTGINASLFNNLTTQVCILEFASCPNGQHLMEGAGAADTGITTNAQLAHGTEMAGIIAHVAPGVNLIPIRITPVISANTPGLYTNQAVKLALDWVIANQTKYNIVAVNVSVGGVFLTCQTPTGTQADVDALKAVNVPVIAATGNNSNRTSVNSIACLPNVISVGATDNPALMGGAAWDPNAKPTIGLYSNGNASTTFYTNGRWIIQEPNGKNGFVVGTSPATAALTGYWVANYKGSYDATLSWINSITTPTSNQWLTGKYVKITQ
jgi:hypothetical protein